MEAADKKAIQEMIIAAVSSAVSKLKPVDVTLDEKIEAENSKVEKSDLDAVFQTMDLAMTRNDVESMRMSDRAVKQHMGKEVMKELPPANANAAERIKHRQLQIMQLKQLKLLW